MCRELGVTEQTYVNRKKIQRIWRDAGLRVTQCRRRKQSGTSTAGDRPTADDPDRVWAVDFRFDATIDGRPINLCRSSNTRDSLVSLVDRSVIANVLIDELDRPALWRVYPSVLRCDKGPELACEATADWAG